MNRVLKLIFLAALFCLAGCKTGSDTDSGWEYKTVSLYPFSEVELQRQLQQFAADGWQIGPASRITHDGGDFRGPPRPGAPMVGYGGRVHAVLFLKRPKMETLLGKPTFVIPPPPPSSPPPAPPAN